jgi:hypothetical protein
MQNADRTEIWRYGDTIFCFRKLAEYSRGFQLVARVVYTEKARHKTDTHHKWCRAVYLVLPKPHSNPYKADTLCKAAARTEQTNQAEYLRATKSAVSWFVVFHTGIQFC